MAQVTRMLLWGQQLPLQLFEGELDTAERKLNTCGHVVIDAEEKVSASSVGVFSPLV